MFRSFPLEPLDRNNHETPLERTPGPPLASPGTLVSARQVRAPPQSTIDRRYGRGHAARCPHLKNNPTRTIR